MTYTAGALLFLAALYNALDVFAQNTVPTDPYTVTNSLEDVLNNNFGHNQSLTTYPTDLTRNLVPKNLHSHNDYWRDVPFYSALSVGAISIEADVWLYNDTLYVGHEESALTHARTFQSLYIQPMLAELKRMNPSSPFVTSPTKNGLFDTSSSQTMYLWVDVKTDGPTTFPAVIRELEPLRSAGFLTNYTGSAVTTGPVTVIGTGNTPLNQIQGVSPRDYFYDAPLPLLATTFDNITSDVTPIASVDFGSAIGDVRNGTFSSEQLATLRRQIATAKAKGIGARYWDTPGFPIAARNRIWSTLWSAGVALVNVDDLDAGAGYSDYGNYWDA